MQTCFNCIHVNIKNSDTNSDVGSVGGWFNCALFFCHLDFLKIVHCIVEYTKTSSLQ